MSTSFFMTIEGPDGAGKTTLLKKLEPLLAEQFGDRLVITREPGGVRIAEEIRKLVLGVEYPEIDPRTEALLFAAARAQHLAQVVTPNLQAGKIVLSDRFVDSSIAYQGAGRQLGVDQVAQINQFATNGLQPDLTLYLDIPSKIGLERIAKNRQNEVNRLDKDSLAFHQRVRQAYLDLAEQNPHRIFTLDATKKPEQLVVEALELINEGLSKAQNKEN